MINSTPKIKLILNKLKPTIYKKGVEIDKLYVARRINEIIPRIEQKYNPYFIIIFTFLSNLLK